MDRLSKILVVAGAILLLILKVIWGLLRFSLYIGTAILSLCASMAIAGGMAGMLEERERE
ncbi:hypothetical protein V9K67_21590 [Paraflavisolibacter sp. H34]|uniref:hypothetical protein n=1 Tax=Huijunlia imazamoxiresistens TaxID=3127457 RepID=UPI0030178F52